MPWSVKQHRLFEVAARDKKIADEHGIKQKEAEKLAEEGVEKSNFINLERVFYPLAKRNISAKRI